VGKGKRLNPRFDGKQVKGTLVGIEAGLPCKITARKPQACKDESLELEDLLGSTIDDRPFYATYDAVSDRPYQKFRKTNTGLHWA
jgi:hypothetical protein